MSIIEKLKNYILSTYLTNSNNEIEFATKEDLKISDSIEEKLDTLDRDNEIIDISESAAYNIYQAAYSSIEKNKIKNNKAPTYNDLFNLSQEAFLLAIKNFKYSILNCSIDSRYIDKLIYKKMREYNSYLDFNHIKSKHKDIDVKIEFISFYDNSALSRINILDKNISNMYLDVFKKNENDFNLFLNKNNQIIIDKTKDLISKEKNKDKNKTKTNDDINEITNDAYKFQSDLILKMTDFTYKISYNSFLSGFLNSVLIDINYFDSLLNDITKYKSINNNTLNFTKSNITINDKNDFLDYLKTNNLTIQKIK